MNNFVDETKISEDKLFEELKGFIKVGMVTPLHLLRFAKWILLILAVIFVGACLSEYLKPANAIYETCKVTIPSLATLVIGYYFGTTKS